MVANESRSSDKSGAAARTQKASALCTYLWDAAKNSADPMAWKTSRRARGNAASTTQRDSNVTGPPTTQREQPCRRSAPYTKQEHGQEQSRQERARRGPQWATIPPRPRRKARLLGCCRQWLARFNAYSVATLSHRTRRTSTRTCAAWPHLGQPRYDEAKNNSNEARVSLAARANRKLRPGNTSPSSAVVRPRGGE